MTLRALFASAGLHAVVVLAIAGAVSRREPERREPEPIFFEVIEESAVGAGEAASEAAETVARTAEPPPEETVPPDEPTERNMLEVGADPPPEAPALEMQTVDHVSKFRDDEVVPDAAADADAEESAETRSAPPEEVSEDAAPQDPSGDVERNQVVSPPFARNRIMPVYPRSARRKGHEGTVEVLAGIDERGRTVSLSVVRSSGFPELDEAALKAVGTAEFAPATSDGRAISGEVRLTFGFRLK